jgi:hypothetical protein
MLDQDGRANIQALLSDPINIPDEFRHWLLDWLTINLPPIPVSQISGYKGTLARVSVVNDQEQVDSAWHAERDWTDLPSDGPRITGIADGTYFAAYGCQCDSGPHNSGIGAWNDGRVGASINDADPPTYWAYTAPMGADGGYPVWRAHTIDVTGGGNNNDVSLKYYYDLASGAVATFLNRWLVLIRVT